MNLEKHTAQILDDFERKGWIVYWNKKDKSIFRITDAGTEALAEMRQQEDPK